MNSPHAASAWNSPAASGYCGDPRVGAGIARRLVHEALASQPRLEPPRNPLSLPNLITLSRILLVPVIIWLLVTGRMQMAFVLFVVAGISDAVDGFIAKRFDSQTELGAYLDPLADKLLLVCVFIALGVRGELPVWLPIAIVSRDLLIVSAVVLSWLLGNPVRIRPLTVSKLTTTAQILLAAVVLADAGWSLQLGVVRWLMVWLTAALTLASLAAYMNAWMRHMSGQP